jgi:hypothetical protein
VKGSHRRAIANAALAVLDKNRGYLTNTTALFHSVKNTLDSIEFGWVTQADVRYVMNLLRNKGTVDRFGQGKHKWKIKVSSWNLNDPLAVQEGATPLAESEQDEEGGEETNETNMEGLPVETHTDPQETRKLKERIKVLEERAELAEQNDTVLAMEMDRLKAVAERHVKVLKIERWDGKVIKIKDAVLPAVYEHVLDLAKCRRNILLVGPAGCGKSTLAELVAKSLGLAFYKVGGSGGLSEEHLLGYSRPNLTNGKDKFITTPFLTAFEDGGLVLVDELDGANENALLALNPALDRSGKLPVPNRDQAPIAKKHPDFVCIGTANTFGRGADRKYVGRNQLDEATLDRFRIGIVECDYDPVIEAAVCPDDEIRNWCQSVRKQIFDCGLRRIMSTRFMEDAFILKEGAGWDLKKIQNTFFEGWTAEERGRMY